MHSYAVLKEDLHQSLIRVERFLQDFNRSGVAELPKDACKVSLGNSAWLGTLDFCGRREHVAEVLLILLPCETLYKVSDLKSDLEFDSFHYELEDPFEELLAQGLELLLLPLDFLDYFWGLSYLFHRGGFLSLCVCLDISLFNGQGLSERMLL